MLSAKLLIINELCKYSYGFPFYFSSTLHLQYLYFPSTTIRHPFRVHHIITKTIQTPPGWGLCLKYDQQP